MFKNIIKLTATVLFTLSIAACLNGGGDDVKVKTFKINGSTSELEEGRVVIDSNIDSGKFELVWEVDDDNATGYNAFFYLSIDDDLSRSKDIEFYDVYCGETGRCDHDDDNDEDCWFDNDQEMVCEDDDNPSEEVDDLISELPEDLYIIIEACNDFDCDTEAVPVRLR